MRAHMFLGMIAVLFTAIFVSCSSIKESDRQLNYQNLRAAELMHDQPNDPKMVKQVSGDIVKNSTQLGKVLGLPKDPQPYSSKASAGFRKQSVEDHKRKWWQIALLGIGTFLLGGGIVKAATKIFPKVFGGPLGLALSAVVEGAANLLSKAKTAPDGKISVADATDELRKAADNAGVREVIRSTIRSVKKKLSKST